MRYSLKYDFLHETYSIHANGRPISLRDVARRLNSKESRIAELEDAIAGLEANNTHTIEVTV